jgi:hypothetical protein
MNGVVNPAAIALSISIGAALLAGFFSVLVAVRSGNGAAHRDTTVSILFGIALLIMLLNVVAAAFIAAGGMRYVGLVRAAMLLTAAFAVTGTVIGVIRGLRSGRTIKTQMS